MLSAATIIASTLTGEPTDPRSFPWATLTYRQTAAVRAQLQARYAPATANKVLACLRGILKEAWRLGDMTAEAYNRAADLERVRGHGLLRGRALSAGELRALFRVCADAGGPRGARDAALFALMYGGGLRRAEAVALNVNSYNPTERTIAVREGKGRRSRIVPLPVGAVEAVEFWLSWRKRAAGPLFCRIRADGRPRLSSRLRGESVGRILARRALEAGVGRAAPHDLRRSFVSDLLDAGADLAVIQRLAGHQNVDTTARYDRRGDAAKRRAADLLSVPFSKSFTGPGGRSGPLPGARRVLPRVLQRGSGSGAKNR